MFKLFKRKSNLVKVNELKNTKVKRGTLTEVRPGYSKNGKKLGRPPKKV